MKKVEAIIRKSKFREVKEALHDIEVNFFSYWDVTGVGNEKVGKVYRGITYSTSDIQRRYLSIIVSDSFLDRTVEAILKSASTDNVGDGKIFISDIKEAYRIRTGEKGNQSLN
ncbi:MAG: transcriptional regulator [Flavobacteriaceae bacterium]|jgi:nitrogen regulatory protein P-II 1|nr:transcriptional regulator [Flavobacteriaceae bacterium]|tara:strand:- start:2771 stop:3109 length:339 start_codon:yes stop_codon:yes gene_type:complete